MKKYFKKIINYFGYDISRLGKGFTFNRNLKWLQAYNINAILDIGANEGQFVKFISDYFPHADIHSFEPLLDCYEKLNVLKSQFENLKTYNFGFGDKNEVIEFNRNDFTLSSSILSMKEKHIENFPYTHNTVKEKIQIQRLDDFVKDMEFKPNILLKIDVQGYEKKVLSAGTNFISKLVKVVIIETSITQLYEGESEFPEIFKFFTDLDYKFSGVMDQLYSPNNGEILQLDSIFIKN